MNKLNEKKLIEFENKIADHFNSGKIKAPIHLYYGNESNIIKVFEQINDQDWIFCSWRSHYQCLLKGVPETLLEQEIIDGKSISLCFPDYKIYSSAIVGGNIPIAVGVAKSIQLSNSKNKVYCFMGDMTSESGIAHECIKYSRNYKLPIHFIVEDNGKSVCSITRDVWKQKKLTFENVSDDYVTYYSYETKYPHAGAGKRVQF